MGKFPTFKKNTTNFEWNTFTVKTKDQLFII